MGTCAGKRQVGSNNTSRQKKVAANFTFDLDLILNELKKFDETSTDTSLININSIKNELKNLHNLQGFDIRNFNPLIGIILLTTCFSREQQLKLMQLVMPDINSVSVNDLLLSCHEYSTCEISILILEKLVTQNDFAQINLNQNFSLRNRFIGFNDESGSLLDCFLYKFKQFYTFPYNKKTILDYQYLIGRLIDTGFKLSNQNMINSTTNHYVCLIFLFYDLKDLLVDFDSNNTNTIKFISLFNTCLSKVIKRVLTVEEYKSNYYVNVNLNGEIYSSFDAIKECMYDHIKKSPNMKYLDADVRSLLKTLCKPNRFQPLRLDELCRLSSPLSSLKCKKYASENNLLPKRLIRFLSYEQEWPFNYLFYSII